MSRGEFLELEESGVNHTHQKGRDALTLPVGRKRGEIEGGAISGPKTAHSNGVGGN